MTKYKYFDDLDNNTIIVESATEIFASFQYMNDDDRPRAIKLAEKCISDLKLNNE